MDSHRILLLEKFIEEEPENPFNLYALAMEYLDTDEEKASTLFEQLTDRFPSYLPTYYKYAHLLWEMQDVDGAEKLFKLGIQLAEQQQALKALGELKSAYQNFLFEKD